MQQHLLRGLAGATLALGMTAIPAAAAAATTAPAPAASAYNQPPKEILDVMRAPASPTPSLSPKRDKLMLVTMEEYPSIAKVAMPFLRLAGVRIEPGNHSQHDTRAATASRLASARSTWCRWPMASRRR